MGKCSLQRGSIVWMLVSQEVITGREGNLMPSIDLKRDETLDFLSLSSEILNSSIDCMMGRYSSNYYSTFMVGYAC